jgi:hypothetical protein
MAVDTPATGSTGKPSVLSVLRLPPEATSPGTARRVAVTGLNISLADGSSSADDALEDMKLTVSAGDPGGPVPITVLLKPAGIAAPPQLQNVEFNDEATTALPFVSAANSSVSGPLTLLPAQPLFPAFSSGLLPKVWVLRAASLGAAPRQLMIGSWGIRLCSSDAGASNDGHSAGNMQTSRDTPPLANVTPDVSALDGPSDDRVSAEDNSQTSDFRSGASPAVQGSSSTSVLQEVLDRLGRVSANNLTSSAIFRGADGGSNTTLLKRLEARSVKCQGCCCTGPTLTFA